VLMSMTGFGEARSQLPHGSVQVDARSVNNRHLKVTVRGTEPYPQLESEFEKLARRTVKRGTLSLQIRVDRGAATSENSLNVSLLTSYLQTLQATWPEMDPRSVVPSLLGLPGVVGEQQSRSKPPDEEWPIVEKTVRDAIAKLDQMRRTEGQAMAEELLALHRYIREQLDSVRGHLPQVMGDYRARLLDRVRQAIVSAGVAIEPDHLVREVAMYADRTDVAEELTRLDAHLVQFEEVIRKETDGPGRRLEFILQEIVRETNTLGSKAGDVTISRHVVEIKSSLEKIRELVLNIE
jgi:uncharacterized protein (TIGR00255 family)